MNQPFKNLLGEVPLSEMFRPVYSNETLVCTRGNTWKRVTATGWKREEDNFFWPFHPNHVGDSLYQLPPTIEDIQEERKTR